MTHDPVDPPLLVPLSEASGLCGGPGQMSCTEANELIQAYIDHNTDADTGALVAEHLGDCPPCESEFAVYQQILEALNRCRPDVPPETAQRLQKFCASLCDGAEVGVAAGAPASDGSPSDAPASDLTAPQSDN